MTDLQPNILSFLLFAVSFALIYASLRYSVLRYKTIFTPLFFKISLEFGFITVVSSIAALFARGGKLSLFFSYNISDFNYTLLVSIFSAASLFCGYHLCAQLPLSTLSHKLFSKFDRSNRRLRTVAFFSICFSLLAFAFLVFFTSGATLWLTDSRTAYIQHRSGAGQYYAFFIWGLSIAQILLLASYSRSHSFRLPLLITLLVSLVFFFSGSKGAMLTPLFNLIIFYDQYIKRVSLVKALFLSLLLIFAIILLLFFQQTNALDGVIYYFSEYFSFTSEYIHRSGELGFMFGSATLSSLQSMLPRSIFPDKSYIYGVLYIHELITPGAAETGNTFGVLPWSLSYLDFGFFGVIISSLISGLFCRIFYDLWYFNPTAIRFVAALSFTMLNPLPFTNFVAQFLILFILVIATKSTLVSP